MQVALYARVSTSQQEKTDTIESQLEALQAYVATYDHTVLPEHLFLDNGVSGSRLDRPALDRLRGYPLKAGQLEYDCRYSTMHSMPVTGGRGFRGLKPLWYNGVPP